jgi:ribose 5-phosphate isomerase B
MEKRIGIACDHAGFEYKEKLVKLLENKGYIVTDYGCYSTESVDYPDFAHSLSKSLENFRKFNRNTILW